MHLSPQFLLLFFFGSKDKFELGGDSPCAGCPPSLPFPSLLLPLLAGGQTDPARPLGPPLAGLDASPGQPAREDPRALAVLLLLLLLTSSNSHLLLYKIIFGGKDRSGWSRGGGWWWWREKSALGIYFLSLRLRRKTPALGLKKEKKKPSEAKAKSEEAGCREGPRASERASKPSERARRTKMAGR